MKFIKYIKKNPVAASVAYSLRTELYRLEMARFKKTDIMPNSVLFNNFNGKGYGDNPKAIAVKLHDIRPDYSLYWIYKDQNAKESLPDYIIPVRLESKDYFRIMAAAACWVFNVLPPEGAQKKKEQLYIQTWHGDRALKRILNDAISDSDSYRKRKRGKEYSDCYCDYMVVACDWFIPVWRSAAAYKGEFLQYGMPRNDSLVNCESEKSQAIIKKVRNYYKVEDKCKILLYAPTFRDHNASEGDIGSNIDLNIILNILKEKDGQNWVCFARAHSGAHIRIGNSEKRSQIIDTTLYPDMADLLLAADMLITDYSSSAGDFALTGRQILLYQDDIEEYKAKDRTFYYDMNETPYFIAHNMQEAERIIINTSPEQYEQNCQDILDFYRAHETGHSAEEVCSLIVKRLRV